MGKNFDYASLETLDLGHCSESNTTPSNLGTECNSSSSSDSSCSSSSDSSFNDCTTEKECERLSSMESCSSSSSNQSCKLDDSRCLVLILSTSNKVCHKNVEKLQDLFSHSYFITKHLDCTKDLQSGKETTSHCVIAALSYAHSQHNSRAVLVIQDTSLSILDAELITGRVKGVVSYADKYDLFYLCKWMDKCSVYQAVDKNLDTDSLYYTKSPHGLQAILFTPRGRDILLGQHKMKNGQKFKEQNDLEKGLLHNIGEGHILATTCLTNWVDFDMACADSNDLFVRMNQCSLSNGSNGSDSTTMDVAAWIWLVIIIILVVLIAWAIIKMTP